MIGNGLAIDTPIRPALATGGTSPAPAAIAPAEITRPLRAPVEVVSVKDLAAKPTPPVLNHKLLANYPALAKQQGRAGSAVLLVRIDADGVVRQCTVQSESSDEFGAACRRTLLGSQWSAPHDRTGRAVVTQVYYTCDFRVGGS
jgi:TonB family protein